MVDLQELADQAWQKCQEEGWGRDWKHAGAYLHLESSEFVEALRGKRGDAEKEAADILFVLLSTLASRGIRMKNVVEKLRRLM